MVDLYGRVRAATGLEGNIVGIETMEVRPESVSFVQRKVEMAQTILKLVEMESQSGVLKCIDALHTEGKGLHDFY